MSRMKCSALACLLFIIVLTQAMGCSRKISSKRETTIELKTCFLEGLSDEAQCGYVTRPISSDPQDGTIDVHFAILPAAKARHPDEAIMTFAGGPGQSGLDVGKVFVAALMEANRTRDIILVDQRGTGRSHKLSCKVETLEQTLSDPTLDVIAKAIADTEECKKTLSVDLSHFGTIQAAADYDAIRQATGYSALHLYGSSYGTRIAQEYTRQFPEHVRTMVLDGVVPRQQSLVAIGLASQIALEELVKECAEDTKCQNVFPEFGQELETLLEKLRKEPVSTTIRHPVHGEDVTFVVTEGKVDSVVRSALYTNIARSMIPLAIHKANQGDFAMIATMISTQFTSMSLATGMYFAVVCAEDWPRLTTASRERYKQSKSGALLIETLDAVCPIWKVRPVPESFYQAPDHDIPTLLLSGEIDPATPPSWAELGMKEMKNATHLVAKTANHGVAYQTCAGRILAEFLDEPDGSKLQTECLSTERRYRFLLNSNATSLPTPGTP